MTATKACTRHARETNRKRDQPRRPKATSDNNKANRVEAAKPPAALAVAPDGTGTGGAFSGTDPNEAAAPDPEAAAAAVPAAQGEKAGDNSPDAEPEPTETAEPG